MMIILIGIIAFLTFSIITGYKSKPLIQYKIDTTNLIDDGNFESFNQVAGDCCNGLPGIASIFVSKSTEAFDGIFSLNLTSSNHCACIAKQINLFSKSNQYILSFYYKGDNPRICGWTTGDNKCIPAEKFDETEQWNKSISILTFTPKSQSASIYFYADSDGTKTVTNLYDDLQVHKLILYESGTYSPTESYVVKTKADNNVLDFYGNKAEQISDVVDGDAYFLTKGEPIITIKFPYSELIIIIVLMLILARLILKKKEPWEK